jgi:hypothetical protein
MERLALELQQGLLMGRIEHLLMPVIATGVARDLLRAIHGRGESTSGGSSSGLTRGGTRRSPSVLRQPYPGVLAKCLARLNFSRQNSCCGEAICKSVNLVAVRL